MWTEESFQEWRGRPETKAFFAFLREVREELKERWASGEAIDDKSHAIAIVYGDIIDLDYERDVKAFYERKYSEESDDVSE